MHHYAILLGGHLLPTPRLSRQLADARFIAADSGINHALTLGVTPELWLGDFDSSDEQDFARHADVPRQSHPVDKDKSDGAIAIDEAMKRGASKVTLVGAFGGRFDHALSHGLQLLALRQRGVDGMMTSGNEEAYPLIDTLRLDALPKGTTISILGLTRLAGLSVTGVRWPLSHAEVQLGSTWTISNESLADVVVTVEHGHGLVLACPGGRAS